MSGPPPLAWVSAPWWEVYGAELRAERLSGRVWLERLARAWQLVRMPASLTPAELERQTDMVERLMGRRFYLTEPVIWPAEPAGEGAELEP